MKKIGVFLNNEIVSEYPLTYEGGQEALSDAKEFMSEEGQFYEVRIYDEAEEE